MKTLVKDQYLLTETIFQLQDTDPYQELQILEASCKPAYLLARASADQG